MKVLHYSSWLLVVLSLIIGLVNIITFKFNLIGEIIFIGSILIAFIVFLFVQIKTKKKLVNAISFNSIFSFGFKNKIVGYFYIAINCIALITIIISVFFHIIYGGSPEEIEGLYCIINHGRIIRDNLTINEYNLLVILGNEIFPCASIIINSLMLGLSKNVKSINVK